MNFGSRIYLEKIISYVPSIIIAYCIGMITAFVLNRIFVFRETDNSLEKQIFWFLAINIIALLQTVFISLILADWLFPFIGITFYPKTTAHAVGVIVPVITSYFGHKHLSFRKNH